MEASRVNWNDDRIDRLADEVAELRRHMDARFEKQEACMQERFEKQEARMQERFEKQDAKIVDRFDRLQNSLIITLAGILAAFTSVVLPAVF
jgi:hypothetical protein